MKTGKKYRTPLALFLYTTLVFFLLYRRFIFGNTVYLYSDTGSDSLAASYPILAMLSYLFRSGTFSSYTLFAGLGQDTTAQFLQFLNPFKFFMLFFDKNSMIYAIVIQLYLQTVASSFAFYYYIRRYLKTDAAGILAAAAWSFASFTVLWSQNLSYGTAVCMFTISILCIENLLEKGTLKSFLVLAIVLASFLCSNYYFCYMTAVFTILYIPVRAVFKRVRFTEMLLGMIKTGAAALFAVCMSAAAVVAIAAGFLSSARTEDVHALSYFTWKINPRFALAVLARLFSENMLGLEGEYKGPTNYYEIGAVFTTALFLFAFFYLIRKKGFRWKILLLTAVSFAALMFPALRYLLDLSSLCMRFSFMICFLEAILTAYFADRLLTEFDARGIVFSVVLTAAFTAVSFAVLFLTKDSFTLGIPLREVLLSAGTMALYALFFLLIAKKILPLRTIPYALFGLFMAETVIMHHDSLYLRLYLTKDSFHTAYFNSGTAEAVDAATDADPSLYRIATTEEMDLSNEGQVDHFNGTTLRNNTNPQSLISLEETHGTNERYEPYFLSGYPQYYQYTLLSGRYYVTTEYEGHRDLAETGLFTKAGEYPGNAAGTTKAVYENINALPFGYLYTKQTTREAYDELDLMDKMQTLTQAWFYTDREQDPYAATDVQKDDAEGTVDGQKIEPGEAAEDQKDDAEGTDSTPEGVGSADGSNDDVRIDLIRNAEWTDANNMTIKREGDGLRLVSDGVDPYIFVYFDDMEEDSPTADFLLIKAKTEPRMFDLELFYLDGRDASPNPDWRTQLYFDGTYTECLLLLPEGVKGFRFDFDDDTDKALLDSMELIRCSDPASHFEELRATNISDISFAGDTYRATVTSGSEEGMLCIPILYSRNWSASVDGEGVKLSNINGGFLGLPLSEGTHEVVVRYTLPHFKTGVLISLLSLAVYAVLWIVVLRKKKAA